MIILSFILSIVDVNQNPSIDSMSASKTIVNNTENITFTATASDPESDPLTLRWEVLNTTGAIIKTYSGGSSITHQFNVSGVYQVKFNVTDSYNGSVEQIIENIIVNQRIIIAANTTVTFIPWQTDDKNASDIASELSLNTGDVIKKFDPTTGAYSNGWIVDPLLPSQSDFTVRKGDMVRIELINETSQTNGITAVVSTTSSSDYSVEVPLNYTYNSTTKSGNPGYNYVAWVSEKVITADQLAQQIGLASGQTISKYDPDSDSWQGYIYGVGLEGTSLNFNIYPGDVVCIKINEGVAGKILKISCNDVQTATAI